jgi:uncharacterized lipoprotein YmbA
MKATILALATLLLAACATSGDDKTAALSEDDPVQDFIQLHDLEEVRVVRGFESPSVLYMEDLRYIIAYLRDEQWLLQYDHPCRLVV